MNLAEPKQEASQPEAPSVSSVSAEIRSGQIELDFNSVDTKADDRVLLLNRYPQDQLNTSLAVYLINVGKL